MGLPWWCSGRLLLPLRETQARSLLREDPTCCGETRPVGHTCCAPALEPGSHKNRAHTCQLLRPACSGLLSRSQSLGAYSLCLATREARRSPCTAAKSSPACCSWRKLALSNQDPAQPKIHYFKKTKKNPPKNPECNILIVIFSSQNASYQLVFSWLRGRIGRNYFRESVMRLKPYRIYLPALTYTNC